MNYINYICPYLNPRIQLTFRAGLHVKRPELAVDAEEDLSDSDSELVHWYS
jgi:hypothetical protein